MKLTFLGTGISQGVPIIACQCEVCRSTDTKDKRLRTSVHIQVGEKSIVIDSGPDFRYQMLRAGITKIEALLFTHEHRDHTAGIDDIRALNWINKSSVRIYAEKRVEQYLHKAFFYIFQGRYPNLPRLDIREINGTPFYIENIKVTPIRMYHGSLPIYGFRIGDISYLTDVKTIPEEEYPKLKNTKILVLSALRNRPHYSHLTLKEAVSLAQEIGAEKTYFTHISHQLGKHAKVQKKLPQNIFLAYDMLTVSA